ncbi:MAG: septal ring lytic transglycosylase RlpA family protein [Saprospiraceae bacterium]
MRMQFCFISLLLLTALSNIVAQESTGVATYYSNKFAGNRTSNGEIYKPKKLTAAHPSLPFGTCVEVTDLSNGKSVIVRINDRLPKKSRYIIDLSHRAAKQIGMIRKGKSKVKLTILAKDGDCPPHKEED